MTFQPLITAAPPQDPTFTIQQVSDLTGLTTSVLRIWELRYGWPVPQRNPVNGYRRYKQYQIDDLRRMKELTADGTLVSRLVRDGVPQWPTDAELVAMKAAVLAETAVPPLKDDVEQKLRAAGALVTDENRMQWAQLVQDRNTGWMVATTAQAALRSRRRVVTPEEVDALANPRKATVWRVPVPVVAPVVEVVAAPAPPEVLVGLPAEMQGAIVEFRADVKRVLQDADAVLAAVAEQPVPDRLSTPSAKVVPRPAYPENRCYAGVLKRYLAVLVAAEGSPLRATDVADRMKCGHAPAIRYLKRIRGLLHVTYGLYRAMTVTLNAAGRERARELGLPAREPEWPAPVASVEEIVVPEEVALPPEPEAVVEAEVPADPVVEEIVEPEPEVVHTPAEVVDVVPSAVAPTHEKVIMQCPHCGKLSSLTCTKEPS